MFCSSCGAESSAAARFCSDCGRPFDSASDATLVGDEASSAEETLAPASAQRAPSRQTAPALRGSRPASGSSGFLSSSDAIGGERFTPGQIIADRYRVVALAGRGGMGEVYRAEDLKLGQIVAIKFLPASLSKDAGALARFHSEVRIARQVSHPNVCRVFDIGDADGIPFLTMEYVDGEDLASLVRRIGRLSSDKAIEIARQVCAGLAAAHERGVIHRDLKPANLMLDGTGKIRITDFGLAAIAASLDGTDVRAGTPAYMAPEQLEGKEVTAKSDLYSLGLVLYEILTGRRVFDATTLPELMKQREKSAPASPSSLVRDLDPVVERVILRCLENDPARRPASALQVAAALPGGDPLAAALAAGETPSPQMVAAAGETEGMRPRIAVSLLACVVIGVVGLLWGADRYRLHNLVPLENPPEVLTARARDIIRQLGYTDRYADEAYSFQFQSDYIDYIREHDKTPGRWTALASGQPASLIFWYRRSPRELRPQGFFSSRGTGGVTPFDPPLDTSGMIFIALDTDGRLLRLEIVPPQKDVSEKSSSASDWSSSFAAAGLDKSAYKEVEPEWTPPAFGDTRAAWAGTMPGKPEISQRIEAAAYRGKPVYFDVIYPWTKPVRQTAFALTQREVLTVAILVALFVALIVIGLFIARRNVRAHRTDAPGTFRLGAFVLLMFLSMWLLHAHHVASLDEFDLILIALSWALLVISVVTVFYLALEPYVRRRDPHTLISWARLLAGKWSDPLVGRDLLIGVAYGVGVSVVETSDNFLLPLFGKLPPEPGGLEASALLGVRTAISLVLFYVLFFVVWALAIFFFLFLLRLLLKRDWIAAIVLVLIGAGTNPGGEYPIVIFALLGIIWLSILLVLRRFGMLTLVVGLVVQNVLNVFPTTSHFSRWYASAGLTGIVVILGLAIYGFYTSLGGKPLFTEAALDT